MEIEPDLQVSKPIAAMEENILTEPPAFKLYKERAIFVATFLGGPLVTGYLMAENYRNLGKKNLVWRTWLYALLATAIIVVIAFLLPESTQHSSYIIPAIIASIANYIVNKLQGNQLALHEKNGGQFYSVWRAVIISLIGLALIIGGIILVLYAQTQTQ